MKKLLLLLLLFATPAFAQPNTAGPCPANQGRTIINPGYICVVPASVAEHNATDPLSPAYVARYDLLFFAPGVDPATGNPVQTINIGKPTLNPAGVFWLQRSELGAIPVGQTYRANTVAVNAGNTVSARSPIADPFGRLATGAPSAPDATSVVP